jgi:hypothetical protein
MTKHTAGKYGRTIGQKERKAGWPAPSTAWCYVCNGDHAWVDGCPVAGGHPAFAKRKESVAARRPAARAAA